jgi:hypothetical protein
MNEANVAALKALLVEVLEPGNLSADEVGDLAEDLAAHGVLAPSSLTPEQAREVAESRFDFVPPGAYTTQPPLVIAALERIARGERP